MPEDAIGDLELTELDGFLFDPETGEIFEWPEGEDHEYALVFRRHHAKEQEDQWAQARKLYDVMLKGPGGLTQKYQAFPNGRLTAKVAGRRVRRFDAVKFLELLMERYPYRSAIEAWIRVIASATSFRTAADKKDPERMYLDEKLRELFEEASEFYEVSWIETARMKDEAPVPTRRSRGAG